MTELSIVLISRNQEWNIARLVESVLAETGSLPEVEVVLVDSASTDRTTEIACGYPISVLKLSPGQHLSAAAGRYVGYKRTTGDLVLFLDGDMELCRGWLVKALAVMQTRPEIAVVCGKVVDRLKDYLTSSMKIQSPRIDQPEPITTQIAGEEVLQGGGAAMYRRSILEQVGTFNPYLFADEEPELCLRIRHAGFIVFQLDHPIAFHYSVTFHTLSNYLDKRRNKFFYGYGQNMRNFFGSRLLLSYLKERGWAIAPAILIGAGIVAAVVAILTGQSGWIAVWIGFLFLLTLGIAIRKRSLKRALLILFLRLLILEGSIRGFILKPCHPDGYPGKFTIIS